MQDTRLTIDTPHITVIDHKVVLVVILATQTIAMLHLAIQVATVFLVATLEVMTVFLLVEVIVTLLLVVVGMVRLARIVILVENAILDQVGATPVDQVGVIPVDQVEAIPVDPVGHIQVLHILQHQEAILAQVAQWIVFPLESPIAIQWECHHTKIDTPLCTITEFQWTGDTIRRIDTQCHLVELWDLWMVDIPLTTAIPVQWKTVAFRWHQWMVDP